MKGKKLVFMGTPEFAVASLNALVQSGLEVAAVITAPDRKAGRGKKLKASAVSERADALGIPSLKPNNLKSPDFHYALQEINADLFVVVAFRMLPETVWSMPKLGTINLHGSLLPNYRGAAPINWAIINGESETGATTFFIQQKIDTGAIIDSVRLPIAEDETAGELHDKMMLKGAELLVTTVKDLIEGKVSATPQRIPKGLTIKEAPKIHTHTRRIDWNLSAQQVHNHIRGLSPYPAAWSVLQQDNKETSFKLLRSKLTKQPAATPGKWQIIEEKLFVDCSDYCIELLELQPEGKKKLTTRAFLNGYIRNGNESFS